MKIEKCFCCEFETTIYLSSLALGRCENCGYLWQIDAKPFTYDEKYLEKAYGDAPQLEMDWLRIAMLYNFISTTNAKVLDFGCGYGNLVKILSEKGYDSYGHDIIKDKNIPRIKLDVIYKNKWDVIMMYDSLEHLNKNELFKILKVQTKKFVITIPHLDKDLSLDNLKKWKHYKPDEHLHYFTTNAITKLFDRFGFFCLQNSNVEDLIRGTNGKKANTMTYFFVKK